MLAPDDDGAGRAAAQPGDRLGELALAVAGDAGDAEHLAGVHLQRHVVDGDLPAVTHRAEPANLQHGSAGRTGGAVGGQLDRTADHQVGELLARRGLRAHLAGDDAVAHHRDPVGERHHLVQLVRDEHQPLPGVGHPPQRGEQLVDLLGRQHGGRFVEHEQPRLVEHGLEDLDALALADRQLPDLGVRMDAELVLGAQLAEPIGDRPQPERPERVGPLSEGDVLGDGQRRHEHEVLVDHADAGGDGVAR